MSISNPLIKLGSESGMVRRKPHRAPKPRSLKARLKRFLLKLPGRSVSWIFGILIIVFGISLYEYIKQSAFFDLGEMMILGATSLDDGELREILRREASTFAGVNLFLINEEKIESSLAAHPLIRSAKAEKIWPDRLIVEIEERIAADVFLHRGVFWIIDGEGFLMREASVREVARAEGPVLKGLEETDFFAGDQLKPETLTKLRHYRRTFERGNEKLYRQLSEIRWDNERGVMLIFADGTEIYCGQLPPDSIGARLELLLDSPNPPRRPFKADFRIEKQLILYGR